MLSGQAERNRIGTLRVRGGRDGAEVRLALSTLFDHAELRPPEMPPAAVLIVRRMADPLPGRVVPHPTIGGPGGDWESAARERLARLYRHAARPARGPVAGNADAVVFADEGEVLASLALDLVAGRLHEHWWWRSFARLLPLPAGPALAALLTGRAVWVPAALALLAQHGRAGEIARALAPHEAAGVLRVVAEIHGAGAIVAGPAEPPPRAPAPGLAAATHASRSPAAATMTDTAAPDADAATPAAARGGRPVQPPWWGLLPPGAVPPELSTDQASLLGVALVLHHRPEAARSLGFAAGLRRWRQMRGTASAAPDDSPPAAPGAPQTPRRHSRVDSMLPDGGRTVAPEVAAAVSERPPLAGRDAPLSAPLGSAPRHRAAEREPAAASPRPAAGDVARAEAATGGAGSSQSAKLESPTPPSWTAAALRASGAAPRTRPTPPQAGRVGAAGTPEARPAASDAAPLAEPGVAAIPASTFDLALEGGVDTALGGVLFLINAMCALELPGCFERGWRLGSAAGAWGVLEALGRTLLGAHPAHAADPLWRALDTLSGRRSGRRLGAGMPAGAAYRVPARWIEQVPEDDAAPAGWAVREGRLILWSGAGFVLSDTPLRNEREAAQARRTARGFGAAGAPSRGRVGDAGRQALGGFARRLDPAFRRWLALAVPFVRHRLARALGIDPASEPLSEALLVRPGRLYVTATHVDLVMRLDAVSVPARLAGLDRSPGWLGEFGRVILFHFE